MRETGMALLVDVSEVGAELLKFSIVKFSSRAEHFIDRLCFEVGSDGHDLAKVDPLLVTLLDELFGSGLAVVGVVHDVKFLGRVGLLEAVMVVVLERIRLEADHGG